MSSNSWCFHPSHFRDTAQCSSLFASWAPLPLPTSHYCFLSPRLSISSYSPASLRTRRHHSPLPSWRGLPLDLRRRGPDAIVTFYSRTRSMPGRRPLPTESRQGRRSHPLSVGHERRSLQVPSEPTHRHRRARRAASAGAASCWNPGSHSPAYTSRREDRHKFIALSMRPHRRRISNQRRIGIPTASRGVLGEIETPTRLHLWSTAELFL